MEIDLVRGLLTASERVRHVPSPNRDTRPERAAPELVVIHGITLPPGEYGGPWIDRLFTNRLDPEAHPDFEEVAPLRVSAHVLIRRDGEIVQYVPFDERAWHAGVSEWRGRERVNDFSIGIELEGTDETRYEDAQYRVLADLLRSLARAYPTLLDEGGRHRLAGHSDVAPGRKTDPGGSFDWRRLRALLGDIDDTRATRPRRTRMRIDLTSVMVDDQAKAEAFYTETLGFVKKHDVPMGPEGSPRWLTVVSPEADPGPNQVELLLEPNTHPAAQPFQEALYDDGIPAASFACDDVRAEHARLTALGVRFQGEPTQAGPVLIATFEDTCGNWIQIRQMTAEG